MPELPDVEIYKRFAEEHALQHSVQKILILVPKSVDADSKDEFTKFYDSKFIDTYRQGKYLFLKNKSDYWLLMHFGMTGYLVAGTKDEKVKHAAAEIYFDNETKLVFVNPRKLGKIGITNDAGAYLNERKIGPDAAQTLFDDFVERIKQKKGRIKTALMDQSFIAGIGNIYSDEILFQSQIHPQKEVSQLTDAQIQKLYQAIQDVIKTAIKNNADPSKMPSTYILPFRKEGNQCPACKGTIEKIKFSGRGCYFCPSCQKF